MATAQGRGVGAGWYEARAPVSNGPFVFGEAGDERTVFTPNPFWPWSSSNVKEIALEILDPHRARDAWQAGQFDFLVVPERRSVDALDTTVVPVPVLGTQYIGLPDHAPFDDLRVRQALAHAVDRRLLARGKTSPPSNGGFLPPAMPGHSHDLAPAYDIEQARRLLAEAGYPDGRGLPELRLIHADPGLGPEYRREAEAKWTPQWREIGVRMRQDWVGFDEIRREVGVGPSFWEWGWASDYPDPDGLLRTFLAWTPIPHDDELMRLLEQARSLRARDERLELYRAADRRLVAELVQVVPTIPDTWEVVHRPNVDGIWTHPLGMGALDEVIVRRPA